MNYLFHMLLSGDDEELLVGNFMGDFVKGNLNDRFPVRISQGIALHRRIDSFSSRNEQFQTSRKRLDPHYGLYRPVLVDLFYDHFLAMGWDNLSDEPLAGYIARTRAIIDRYSEILPERLQPLVPYIFEEMLPSYAEVSGIGRALERMSRRVKRRDNPLSGGEKELLLNYEGLQDDFSAFMPQVYSFVASMSAKLSQTIE
jgi:acyl carrier protein phosphodiesterase